MQLRNAGLVRRGKIRITPEWQRLILQGLGVLDADGNPTDRLNVVMAADVARLPGCVSQQPGLCALLWMERKRS